jgi:hypothetical protein
MVKVKLETPDGDVETLWATPAGPDLYRLENSPFFAYDVSWLDVVRAVPDSVGQLSFVGVVEKSGHRTIRVILEHPVTDSDPPPIVSELTQLGCTYEGVNPRYLSIDVPPGIGLEAVTDLLIRSGEQWEHGDPRYSQLYPSE